MDTTLPAFLSYKDARVGLVSHGFIVCIRDFGCIVRFYGDVKGLVPTSELTSEPTDNLKGLFYIGQVRKMAFSQLCFTARYGSDSLGLIIFIQQAGRPTECFEHL